MNVFYEEEGAFKAGSVLSDNVSSLQVESPHGKRSKIKASAVLLKFADPGPAPFLEEALKIAEEIDLDFLWECCAEAEFSFSSLALDYFGHTPSAVENAAVLFKLHRSPMHFYKKGKGNYKAAPAESLKAALASVEKKKRLAEEQAAYTSELLAFHLPEAMRPQLASLLFDPDKNTIAFKALDAAAQSLKLSIAQLLEKCGAIPSSHDYHLQRFFFENFPRGIHPPEENIGTIPELPQAEGFAFSIDDSSTTEIDDAFSVAKLPDGSWRVGVHIAAPALAIVPGTAADSYAGEMLSTLYIPGQKFTMLPDGAIEAFTLIEKRTCPVLSLYLQVNPADWSIVSTHNALEKIEIRDNLRHDTLGPYFNETSLAAGARDYPYADELNVLWALAQKLEERRGKNQNVNQTDYNFSVRDDRVEITERKRGDPMDKVVAELMIHANTEWGRQLGDAEFPAIYRSQQNGKVRQGVTPAPHQGLGVAQYAWSTSPLRRYVDLINQRQLIAMVTGAPAVYPKGDEQILLHMRNFEQAYELYGNFQRTMERYWSLRWLLQEGISELEGVVLRESLVKFDRVPLISKSPSLPEMESGTKVLMQISDIDLLELGFHAKFVRKV